MTFFLLITFISETTSTLLNYEGNSNSLVHKIYTPLHILFFVLIYYSAIVSILFKKIVLILGSLVFIFAIYVIVSIKEIWLPSYVITMDALMLVFFSLLLFYEMLNKPLEANLIKSAIFWLNTSVLIYFSATFIYWASFNYLIGNYKSTLTSLSVFFSNYFDPLHYILLGLSLYLHVRNKLSSSNHIAKNEY